jgi:hypothetical protein
MLRSCQMVNYQFVYCCLQYRVTLVCGTWHKSHNGGHICRPVSFVFKNFTKFWSAYKQHTCHARNFSPYLRNTLQIWDESEIEFYPMSRKKRLILKKICVCGIIRHKISISPSSPILSIPPHCVVPTYRKIKKKYCAPLLVRSFDYRRHIPFCVLNFTLKILTSLKEYYGLHNIDWLLTYFLTYLLPYLLISLLTSLLTYFLTYLLYGAVSFLRS